MAILISGASTGIGRATAEALADKGHKVWAGVRDKKVFAELSGLKKENLIPVFLEVTDPTSINKAVASLPRLDALINNAGVVIAGPAEGVRLESWRQQFEINFFGLIALTQACMPKLRASRGRVVNMSSISGRISAPFLGPYSASKFAVEAFSDSLRREVAKFGVKVSIIEPGPIATPIWQKSKAANLDLKSGYSADILELYGISVERFMANMERNERIAAPVECVVEAVEHALISRRPKTRYPVGRGIKFMAALSNILPDRLADKILKVLR